MNNENNQHLTEAEEYEIFLRNQKKYKAQKMKKYKNFFAHILFLIFPGTFYENKCGTRIAKNFIIYGLQTLGVILQITSIVPIIMIFKTQFTLANCIFNIILTLLLLFGGLFIRITGVEYKRKQDNNKFLLLALIICIVTLFLFII